MGAAAEWGSETGMCDAAEVLAANGRESGDGGGVCRRLEESGRHTGVSGGGWQVGACLPLRILIFSTAIASIGAAAAWRSPSPRPFTPTPTKPTPPAPSVFPCSYRSNGLPSPSYPYLFNGDLVTPLHPLTPPPKAYPLPSPFPPDSALTVFLLLLIPTSSTATLLIAATAASRSLSPSSRGSSCTQPPST